MSQDDVPGCGTHNIHNCASLNIEARAHRRIHLGDNYDLIAIEHAQVARLIKIVSDLLHDGQGLRDHALDWRMLLHKPKQMQSEMVTLSFRRLRNVAAFFEAHQHPKNL
jgi:hypothetical protein